MNLLFGNSLANISDIIVYSFSDPLGAGKQQRLRRKILIPFMCLILKISASTIISSVLLQSHVTLLKNLVKGAGVEPEVTP